MHLSVIRFTPRLKPSPTAGRTFFSRWGRSNIIVRFSRPESKHQTRATASYHAWFVSQAPEATERRAQQVGDGLFVTIRANPRPRSLGGRKKVYTTCPPTSEFQVSIKHTNDRIEIFRLRNHWVGRHFQCEWPSRFKIRNRTSWNASSRNEEAVSFSSQASHFRTISEVAWSQSNPLHREDPIYPF